MNWEALEALGTVAGAITTVVMLVYLAIQIRLNSRTTQAATEFEATIQLSNLHKRFADDPELQRIWERVVAHETSLTEAELAHFLWHMTIAMQLCQGVLDQYQRGNLSQSTWNQWEKTMVGALKLPVAYAWWSQRVSGTYSPDFYNFMDDALARDTGQSPTPVNEFMRQYIEVSKQSDAEDSDI